MCASILEWAFRIPSRKSWGPERREVSVRSYCALGSLLSARVQRGTDTDIQNPKLI